MKATNIGIVKAIIAKKMSTDFLTENYNRSKSEANEFVNIIKNSPLLQLEFKVFNRLENKYISNDISATRYIDNNISLFEGYTQKDIDDEHNKINKFIDENVDLVESDKYDLYNAMNSLIYETLNKTNPDVDLIHDSFTTVLNHVKKEKLIKEEKSFELPKGINGQKLIEVALDKFSKKYESLDESDIKFIKTIVLSQENERKSIFEELKNENISLLGQTKKDGIEDKIHETISRINAMDFKNDSSIKDIMSLHELKKGML